MRCPPIRQTAKREAFNDLIERLGGKALDENAVADRETYLKSLSQPERDAYHRAFYLFSSHQGDIAAATSYLDSHNRLKTALGGPESARPAGAARKPSEPGIATGPQKAPRRAASEAKAKAADAKIVQTALKGKDPAHVAWQAAARKIDAGDTSAAAIGELRTASKALGLSDAAVDRIVGMAAPEGAKPSERAKQEKSARLADAGRTGVQPEVPEPRHPARAVASGKETQIRIPGQAGGGYKARYEVRELADTQASHNAFNFEPNPDYFHTNDRDYSNPLNSSRVIDAAKNFQPDYLIADTPTAVDGPPVLDADGNALGGNNRLMTLQRVYQAGGQPAQSYKAMLLKNAQQFGVNVREFANMKAPVLVRVIDDASVESQRAITQLNVTGTAAMTQSEQAIADARKVPPAAIDFLTNQIDKLGEGGTLAQVMEGKSGVEVVNRLIKEGVFTEQERPKLIDDRGLVTKEAKDRVGRALIGRVFRDLGQLESTPQEIRNKLERVIAPLVQVSSSPEWDLTATVNGAVDALREAKAHGIKNLDDLTRQQTMFGQANYTAAEIAVAKKLQESPTKAAKAFKDYARDEADARSGQASLLGPPPSRSASFGEHFGLEAPDYAPLDLVLAEKVAPFDTQLSTEEYDRVVAKLQTLKKQATKTKQPLSAAIDDYLQQGGLFGAELTQPQQALLKELASRGRRAAVKAEQGSLFDAAPTVESRMQQRGQDSGPGPIGGLFGETRLEATEPAPLDIKSQTETSQFKRWFGESRVVDENGKPLVVYHGSPAYGFDQFKSVEGETGKGIFFTDDAFNAEEYGNRGQEDVYAVHLKIEHPKIIDAGGESWVKLPIKTLIAEAHDAGADGLIIRNVRDAKYSQKPPPATTYVVFDPKQIKSAESNRGTFDPASPSILEDLLSTKNIRLWDPEKEESFTATQAELDRHAVPIRDIIAQAKAADPSFDDDLGKYQNKPERHPDIAGIIDEAITTLEPTAPDGMNWGYGPDDRPGLWPDRLFGTETESLDLEGAERRADEGSKAEFAWRDRRKTLAVNQAGLDALNEVRAAIGEPSRAAGTALTSAKAGELAEAARDMASDKSQPQAKRTAFAELAAALDDAASKSPEFALHEVGMRTRGRARHESAHVAQLALERFFGSSPSREAITKLPHFEAARQGLIGRGYKHIARSARALAMEASAHIVGGQGDRLGLSLRQQVEFLDGYFEMIGRTYKADALKRFDQLAGDYVQIRDRVIERLRQQGTGGTGVSRGVGETQTSVPRPPEARQERANAPPDQVGSQAAPSDLARGFLDRIAQEFAEEAESEPAAAPTPKKAPSIEGQTPSKPPEAPSKPPDAAESSKFTGTKNAQTERERELRGLSPVEKQAYTGIGEAYLTGRRAVQSGAVDPRALARSISENPKPLTTEQVGALGFHRTQLMNEHAEALDALAKATVAGDQDAIEAQTGRVARILEDYAMNDQALQRGGREQSAAFNARKMMIADDYSLLPITNRLTVAAGRELTREESGAVRKLVEQENAKSAALQKRLDAAESEIAKLKARGKVRELDAGTETKGARRTKEKLDAELKSLVGQLAKMSVRPAPELLDMAVEEHHVPFSKRSYEAVQRDIDRREDELEEQGVDPIKLYDPSDKANAVLESAGYKPMPKDLSDLYAERESIGKTELDESVKQIKTGIRRTGLTGSETDALLEKYALERSDAFGQTMAARYAQRLAERSVKDQVTEAYETIAIKRGLEIEYDNDGNIVRPNPQVLRQASLAVRSIREFFHPDERRPAGLIAGSSVEESPDPLDIDELSIENPKVVKLIKALAKNRVEAGLDTAEKVTDAVHALVKDHLPGVTKREIADVYSGYGHAKLPDKNELNIRLREVKRQSRLISALEDATEGQAPLRSGLQRDQPSPRVLELQRQVRSMMEQNGIKIERAVRDPEAQWRTALQAYKSRLKTETERIRQNIATGNFAPKERRPLKLDQEAVNLQAERGKAREELDRMEREFLRANRSKPQKFADAAVSWHRTLLLSGVQVAGKLTGFAAGRMITTPLEMAIAQGLRVVPGIRGFAEKSALYGGFNPRAEAAAALTLVNRVLYGPEETVSRAMWNTLRPGGPGKSALDLTYGSHKAVDKEFGSFIGRIHGALKTQTKIAAFQRGWVNLHDFEYRKMVAAGIPPEEAQARLAHPDSMMAIGLRAYEFAQRSILLQDSWLVNSVNAMLGTWEKTGGIPGRIAKGIARFEFPIVKVGSNLVLEGTEYAFGSAKAPAKIAQLMLKHGFRHASEFATEEEADFVMRNFSKGGVGLGILAMGLMGWFGLAFGGYYRPERKKDDKGPQPGGVQLFGVNLPRWAAHHPALELGQMGETARQIYHELREKGESPWRAGFQGAAGAALGLAEEVPYIGEVLRRVHETSGRNWAERIVGGLAKDVTLPPDLPRAARAYDPAEQGGFGAGTRRFFGFEQGKVTRKPEGLVEEVEAGIPGLRSRIPIVRSVPDDVGQEIGEAGKKVATAKRKEGESVDAWQARDKRQRQRIGSEIRELLTSEAYRDADAAEKKKLLQFAITRARANADAKTQETGAERELAVEHRAALDRAETSLKSRSEFKALSEERQKEILQRVTGLFTGFALDKSEREHLKEGARERLAANSKARLQKLSAGGFFDRQIEALLRAAARKAA